MRGRSVTALRRRTLSTCDCHWVAPRSTVSNTAVTAAWSGAQNVCPTLLTFGALAPAGAVILQESAPPLNVGDLLASVVTLSFLVLEAVADETLRRHRASGAKTTCVAGPWAWSRHPNYLGECGFWTGIYLFAQAAGITDISYVVEAFVGRPITLWLFFRFASAPLMEERSSARRKDYDAVSPSAVLVPLPFLSRKAKQP